jgi:WD40 repeat protein
MYINDPDLFATASADKLIKIWSISKDKVVDYIITSDIITSLTFTNDGKQLIIGMQKGQIEIYNVEGSKLRYCSRMEVRNRNGKFKKGEIVSEIFSNNNTELLITTRDKRIRLLEKDVNILCRGTYIPRGISILGTRISIFQ